MMNQEEATKGILDGVVWFFNNETTPEDGLVAGMLKNAKLDLENEFYIPSERLKSKIEEYVTWCAAHQQGVKSKVDAGQLMEQIAALAFDCLAGHDALKSYQSYAPQHDLVVSGSTIPWFLLMLVLGFKPRAPTIVVEAKNTDDPMDDAQFTRLCSILGTKFKVRGSLGVAFTRSGATGFPEPGKARQRKLNDSKATQIIFHAATQKYVVVFDHNDIIRLSEPGSLPKLLRAKINDVEEATGLPPNFDEDWIEAADLPAHLSEVIEDIE